MKIEIRMTNEDYTRVYNVLWFIIENNGITFRDADTGELHTFVLSLIDRIENGDS